MRFFAAYAGMLVSGICAAAIVIPIELENGNPVAQVRINGVDARLIIDSGGDLVSLKPAAVDRVAATRTGSHAEGTNALGQTSAQALLTLDTFEIGGSTFRGVDAQVSGAYAMDAAGDGVIGRRFLAAFVAVYDYPSRRISLFDSRDRRAATRACRGAAVRMRPDDEALVVSDASVDRHEIRVLWDTGAVRSFIKQSFAAANNMLPVESPFYTAREFELGGRQIGSQPFVVVDLQAPAKVDGYLGYDFFVDHVVCIDPRARVVRFRNP
jgi:predicted aspartyl protease